MLQNLPNENDVALREVVADGVNYAKIDQRKFSSVFFDDEIDHITGDELARTINQLVSDTEVAAAQINDGCPFQAQ